MSMPRRSGLPVVVIATVLWACGCLFPRLGIWTRFGGQDWQYGYPWAVCVDQGDVRQDELIWIHNWNFKALAANAVFWGLPIGGAAILLTVRRQRRERESITGEKRL